VDSAVKPHAGKNVRDAILRQPPEAKKGHPIRTTRRSLFRAARSYFFSAEEHAAWDTSSSPQDENATDSFILNFPGPLVHSSKDVDRSGPVMSEMAMFVRRDKPA
jgi:hypothetical protein